MTNLPALPAEDRDPGALGYPPTLPIEVAMGARSIREICTDYGLSKTDWSRISTNPAFIVDIGVALDAVKKEGLGFKTRARIQAVELLKESWRMIHEKDGSIPASVRADLIKFTIRAAGYDGSRDQVAALGTAQNNFQINIDLSRGD